MTSDKFAVRGRVCVCVCVRRCVCTRVCVCVCGCVWVVYLGFVDGKIILDNHGGGVRGFYFTKINNIVRYLYMLHDRDKHPDLVIIYHNLIVHYYITRDIIIG